MSLFAVRRIIGLIIIWQMKREIQKVAKDRANPDLEPIHTDIDIKLDQMNYELEKWEKVKDMEMAAISHENPLPENTSIMHIGEVLGIQKPFSIKNHLIPVWNKIESHG